MTYLPGTLPINKMAYLGAAYLLTPPGLESYTLICVARGSVSWGSKDNDEVGELQLWYDPNMLRKSNCNYLVYARKTAGVGLQVCKVIFH